MKTEILTHCSARLMKLIMNEFHSGRIDPELFMSHTQVKAEFLRDQLDEIRPLDEQENVKNLLKEYDMLISGL